MKQMFMIEPGLIFLNHGSFGACPKPVLDRYQAWQREVEQNPVEFLSRKSGELLYESRYALATYLNVNASDLAFVTNSTTGVNIVARSLRLKPGEEVITSDHEYGACDNIWEHICKAQGAKYKKVTIPLPFNPKTFVDTILKAVTEKTRIIFLSHVTSATALIFPLGELCEMARNRNIITVIDGAHAPAFIDLNLDDLEADFYTGNCHKWLCAPRGSAFLYVRPEHHHLVESNVISWGYSEASEESNEHVAYTGSSILERRLQWLGTRDISAFLTVPFAIAFQNENNWAGLRKKCCMLAVDTMQEICSILGSQPVCSSHVLGQMVVIPIPPIDPFYLKWTLFEQYRIEIPVTAHGQNLFLRLSVQAYNSAEELEILKKAVKKIFSK